MHQFNLWKQLKIENKIIKKFEYLKSFIIFIIMSHQFKKGSAFGSKGYGLVLSSSYF